MSSGVTTYVPVKGKAARNTNDIGSGNTAGGFYIHWDSVNGWTGQGSWYYDDSYLATGWPMVAAGYGYPDDEEGFKAYMVAINPEHINDILSGWSSYGKNEFKEKYEGVLKIRGEGTEGDPNYSITGCIEYV